MAGSVEGDPGGTSGAGDQAARSTPRRSARNRPPDKPGDQPRSGRSQAIEESEGGSPPWQDLPPAQRYVVEKTSQARADLKALKARDPKTWRQIEGSGGLFDQLEKSPDFGYALDGEWEGCYAVHVGRDRYRVIWEPMEPIEDYAGDPGDELIVVAILRVGPKTDPWGHTIYEAPRPPTAPPRTAEVAGSGS